MTVSRRNNLGKVIKVTEKHLGVITVNIRRLLGLLSYNLEVLQREDIFFFFVDFRNWKSLFGIWQLSFPGL